MALSILKDLKEVRGVPVLQERVKDESGNIDWKATDEKRKTHPIYIDQDVCMISFRIQSDPIKEVGVNGCQLDCMIEMAKIMIEKFQNKIPCRENAIAITKLDEALLWLEKRTKDREKRGVEGYSKP